MSHPVQPWSIPNPRQGNGVGEVVGVSGWGVGGGGVEFQPSPPAGPGPSTCPRGMFPLSWGWGNRYILRSGWWSRPVGLLLLISFPRNLKLTLVTGL